MAVDRQRAVEPHLEIVELVDIVGAIGRKQLYKPAEHLVAYDGASQRFRFAVSALRLGQAAQYPFGQDAIKPLEPGLVVVAAASSAMRALIFGSGLSDGALMVGPNLPGVGKTQQGPRRISAS